MCLDFPASILGRSKITMAPAPPDPAPTDARERKFHAVGNCASSRQRRPWINSRHSDMTPGLIYRRTKELPTPSHGDRVARKFGISDVWLARFGQRNSDEVTLPLTWCKAGSITLSVYNPPPENTEGNTAALQLASGTTIGFLYPHAWYLPHRYHRQIQNRQAAVTAALHHPKHSHTHLSITTCLNPALQPDPWSLPPALLSHTLLRRPQNQPKTGNSNPQNPTSASLSYLQSAHLTPYKCTLRLNPIQYPRHPAVRLALSFAGADSPIRLHIAARRTAWKAASFLSDPYAVELAAAVLPTDAGERVWTCVLPPHIV